MGDEIRALLGQINLVVEDMGASVAFYRLLGLAIDEDQPFAEHHLDIKMPNGFALELDSVEFAQRWDSGWCGARGAGRNVIGFNLPTREAVDEAFERLTRAGYRGHQPPYDAFWGARYAVVEDPDRNPVGLMSPIDAKRRSTPPKM